MTGIDEEALKCKATVSVISLSEDKYVYKLTANDGTPYILKGYKVPLSPLDEPGAGESYIEALSQIDRVYQEFYLAKIDSVFSAHYVRPIQIASVFVPPSTKGSEATVFAEILLEHGGESLETQRKKGSPQIRQGYNWMRQSANALAFLHRMGVSYLDIKPSNMVYDEASDLLKVVDMDSSVGESSQQSTSPSAGKSVTSKIRELTIQYAPPEILQTYNNKALQASPVTDPADFIERNIDVYCWAMCFYALLLKKKDKELEGEITRFKLAGTEEYLPFLAGLEAAVDKLPAKDPEEEKLRDLDKRLLVRSLQFSAKDRPKMDDLVKEMRTFEEKEGISLAYTKLERTEQERMNRALGLQDFIEKQQAFLKTLIEQVDTKRTERDATDKDALMMKARLEEMERTKTEVQLALEAKRKELEQCASVVRTAEDVSRMEQDNRDIKLKCESVELELESVKTKAQRAGEEREKRIKDLETAAEQAQKELRDKTEVLGRLEEEAKDLRNINKALMKKCDTYTQLQLKYSEDTLALTKERERLSKKLYDLSGKVRPRSHPRFLEEKHSMIRDAERSVYCRSIYHSWIFAQRRHES